MGRSERGVRQTTKPNHSLREGLKTKAGFSQSYRLNSAITIAVNAAIANTRPSALTNFSTSSQANTCLKSWPGSAGYVTTACRPSGIADHETWGCAATRRAKRRFMEFVSNSKVRGVVGAACFCEANLARSNRGGTFRQDDECIPYCRKIINNLNGFSRVFQRFHPAVFGRPFGFPCVGLIEKR